MRLLAGASLPGARTSPEVQNQLEYHPMWLSGTSWILSGEQSPPVRGEAAPYREHLVHESQEARAERRQHYRTVDGEPRGALPPGIRGYLTTPRRKWPTTTRNALRCPTSLERMRSRRVCRHSKVFTTCWRCAPTGVNYTFLNGTADDPAVGVAIRQ